jgi:pimeloyl-ACP methyl ester carboxylesterase
MKTLQTSTGPIAYDTRGEGPVIVLLPSGGHDHRDYDELRALLPSSLRTISLDWPAHGSSPPGDASASAMRLADVAEELVAQLAPQGAVVVGNSVGGFAATRLAIRRPELVKGLVVIDGGGFAGRPLQARAFCALMARPWFLRRIYPVFSAGYMRARSDADRQARQRALAIVRNEPGLRAVSELWRSFVSPEHDLRPDAPRIAAPTLLLWGRRDPVIPVKIGRRAAAAIPHARLVVLDTGHLPYTSDPAAVAAELLPFAERVFTGRDEAFASGETVIEGAVARGERRAVPAEGKRVAQRPASGAT